MARYQKPCMDFSRRVVFSWALAVSRLRGTCRRGKFPEACSAAVSMMVLPVGRRIWSGLIEAFPDLSVKVRSMFGNKTDAAAEVMIGGTQQKDFMQIRNSGKRYDLPHAFLLRMNDRGLIGELAAYWDNASFYMQLGKTTLD